MGSTGSIGKSLLDVVRSNSSFRVSGLAAAKSIDTLLSQSEELKPNHLILADSEGRDKLLDLAKGKKIPNILIGEDGIKEAIDSNDTDCVVNALSGTQGLIASIMTLKSGKPLFLANKESLVAAGNLLRNLCKEHGGKIIPLDSEHNAIMRCLPRDYEIGENIRDYGVKRIWLTASGGPFWNLSKYELTKVKAADACEHPTWSMGDKISIDSATMMNKGMEIIEAYHLFSIDPDAIEVVVHPQSIVHCLVEYNDGSILAQLSKPDMRITIHQALNYPAYIPLKQEPLNPLQIKALSFDAPNGDKFPCLDLAREALGKGGTAPLALSIADDHAVAAFLADEIAFNDIPAVIKDSITEFSLPFPTELDGIKNLARKISARAIQTIG